MKWQPIETAPKDGSMLLLFNEDGKYNAASWSEKNQRFINQYGFIVPYTTHWMYLPEPPEE